MGRTATRVDGTLGRFPSGSDVTAAPEKIPLIRAYLMFEQRPTILMSFYRMRIHGVFPSQTMNHKEDDDEAGVPKVGSSPHVSGGPNIETYGR